MPKKLLAVWDESRSRFTVGRGLIFLEEINVLLNVHPVDHVTILWCSDRPIPDLLRYPTWSGEILSFPSLAVAASSVQTDAYDVIWGVEPPGVPCSYDESLLYLQRECGSQLPVLTPKPVWREAAEKSFARMGWRNKKIVALHLKNNSLHTLSNGQLKEWRSFIVNVSGKRPSCKFVVVGNERPDSLLDLANVAWTEGADILLDMATIWSADAFMGMSSGFCQVAMFNIKPYAIFKHPGHHTEEMKREFEGRKSFSFINSKQHFLIAHDDAELLTQKFYDLMCE